MRKLCACSLFLALLAAMTVPVRADDAADIRARLVQWAKDFNAGRKAQACDLFSQRLVSDYRGQDEAGYATRCRLLERAIDNPVHQFHYDPAIKEVMVAGDLAIVRLDWILTVTPGDIRTVDTGLDVFRKEADGAWRIIRSIAYEQGGP